MKHAEISDLLGAYALDAVDAAERTTVEEHLRTCAPCRAEVDEHREVAALLAHSGAGAPEGVWQRIVTSLDEAPPSLRAVGGPTPTAAPGAPSAPSRLRWLRPPAIAVAAALVLVAAIGVQVQRQDDRNGELHTAVDDPNAPAYEDAMQDPSARTVRLTSADGSIVVRGAVVDGVAYVRASELPRLASGRTYQLWGVAGDQLVSLAVLGGDPEIIAFPATGYSAFAITEEAAPGVVVSANQPVVTGTVS